MDQMCHVFAGFLSCSLRTWLSDTVYLLFFLGLKQLLLSWACHISSIFLRTQCTPCQDTTHFQLIPLRGSPCWHKNSFLCLSNCYLTIFWAFVKYSNKEMRANYMFLWQLGTWSGTKTGLNIGEKAAKVSRKMLKDLQQAWRTFHKTT